jgi:ribosomal protein S18 acetylase RimI-like enzyme
MDAGQSPAAAQPTTLRRATPADAGTLSRLAARTFTETFGHLYPPEDLAAFLAEAYAEARQATILAHPDYAVWLLESGGEAVGHAAAGPCGLPHPEADPADRELKRLYILAGWQGQGHGERMMATAMEWMRAARPRRLWVGVWSGNTGAQRFYARQGFTKVGEYDFPVGRVVDLEYILRRDA